MTLRAEQGDESATDATALTPSDTEAYEVDSTVKTVDEGARRGLKHRRIALSVVVLAMLICFGVIGIPFEAVQIYLWVGALIIAGCVGRPRAWVKQTVRQWVPFIVLIMGYQVGYGTAGRFHKQGDYPVEGDHNVLGVPLHVQWPIDVDRWMFGGTLPTTWVQEHFHPGTAVPWFAWVITLTYVSHFLVAPISAVVLWMRNSVLFKPWVRSVLAMSGIGLAVYFLYPMSPPWLAGQQGHIPSVILPIGEGWHQLHLSSAGSVMNKAIDLGNPVAAMPSLHMATATLVALILPWNSRWWVRLLALGYPALMAFTLIYGGQHYVIDELFGVLLAVVIVAGWRVLADTGTLKSDRFYEGEDAPTPRRRTGSTRV